MKYIIDSARKPLDIAYTLETAMPENSVTTIVYDAETKDPLFKRSDKFSGKRNVILKLPVTSNRIIVESYRDSNGSKIFDDTYRVTQAKVMPLKKWNVDLGSGDYEYMKFIERICKELPFGSGEKVYRSPSGTFKVIVKDSLSYKGKPTSTPAMVGVKSGTIEVNRSVMKKLTFSQRIAVLSHEYGHFYKNPLVNLDRKDETGADLNGMTLFCAFGYSLMEYVNAFFNVFDQHDTDQNRKRFEVIKMFGKKIHDGKYFGKPYNL